MVRWRLLGFGIAIAAFVWGGIAIAQANFGAGVFAVGAAVSLVYSLRVAAENEAVAGGIAFVGLLLVVSVTAGAIGFVAPSGDSGPSGTQTPTFTEPPNSERDDSRAGGADDAGYSGPVGDYDCEDFSSQSAAQDVHEESGGAHGLDGDGDGEACEHLP